MLLDPAVLDRVDVVDLRKQVHGMSHEENSLACCTKTHDGVVKYSPADVGVERTQRVVE